MLQDVFIIPNHDEQTHAEAERYIQQFRVPFDVTPTSLVLYSDKDTYPIPSSFEAYYAYELPEGQ